MHHTTGSSLGNKPLHFHLQYFSIEPVVQHYDLLIIALAVDAVLLTLYSWHLPSFMLQQKPSRMCTWTHANIVYYACSEVFWECIETVRVTHGVGPGACQECGVGDCLL